MPFSLPELPYAYDALVPYMSRETLEFHHDKHHLAYVNNGNNSDERHRIRRQGPSRTWSRAHSSAIPPSSTMPGSTTITSISGNG